MVSSVKNNSIKNYESPILWFNFSDLFSCILTKSFSFLTNAVWKIVWEGIIGLEQHRKNLAKGISSTTHKLYGNNKYNNILKSVKKYMSSLKRDYDSISHSVMSDSATPWTAAHQASCPSPIPGACSNSSPLSQWCHPTISSSVIPFFSCLQSFPASGSFPRSQFFPSCGQSIGASASVSVLPMNIQDWFPVRLTGLISLQSKGPSRVLSSTTVQNHIGP